MRRLTAAQLEDELRVGTVDLSQVEIVIELGETLEESEQRQQAALASAPTVAAENAPPEKADAPVSEPLVEPKGSASLKKALKAQAKKAKASIPVDKRSAIAAAEADTLEIGEDFQG